MSQFRYPANTLKGKRERAAYNEQAGQEKNHQEKLKEYKPNNPKEASNPDLSHTVETIKKSTDDESKQYVRSNNYTVDNSEILIQTIQNAKLSLIRELYEIIGEEFGDNEANIEYRNYMYDKVILSMPSGLSSGSFDDFAAGMIIDPNTVGDTGLSDGMLNIISYYETGHPFGYTMGQKDLYGYDLGDANGHKTYGYGLLYHPISKQFMDSIKKAWAQSELETLFKVYAKNTSNTIRSWMNKNNVQLNQRQIDAIACACYNFGIGFLNKQICKMIINNPNDPVIFNAWCHLSDSQAQKYPGLVRRRNMEANWYFGK